MTAKLIRFLGDGANYHQSPKTALVTATTCTPPPSPSTSRFWGRAKMADIRSFQDGYEILRKLVDYQT